MSKQELIHGRVYIVGKSILLHKNVWTASYESNEETHVIEFRDNGGYFEGSIVRSNSDNTEIIRIARQSRGLLQDLPGRYEWLLSENGVDIASVRIRGRTLELRLEPESTPLVFNVDDFSFSSNTLSYEVSRDWQKIISFSVDSGACLYPFIFCLFIIGCDHITA